MSEWPPVGMRGRRRGRSDATRVGRYVANSLPPRCELRTVLAPGDSFCWKSSFPYVSVSIHFVVRLSVMFGRREVLPVMDLRT